MQESEEKPLITPPEEHKEAPTLSGSRLGLLVGALFLAICGYFLFALWAGWADVKRAFAIIGWEGLFRSLLIVTFSLSIRFLRWQLLLENLHEKVPWVRSLRIYISGFALCITPMKSGELIRAYFLKEWNVSFRHAFALYFSERVLDMSSVLLIASLGLMGHPEIRPVILFFSLLVIALIYFTGTTSHLLRIESWLKGVLPKKLQYFPTHFIDMLIAFRSAFSPRILTISLFLGTLAWGLEGLACYYLLRDLGAGLSLATTLFIYSFSLIAGAVSFLPAGLGGTEFVMSQLFLLSDVDPSTAAAVVVLIRLCTIWYSVLLGLLFLPKKTIGLHHKEI